MSNPRAELISEGKPDVVDNPELISTTPRALPTDKSVLDARPAQRPSPAASDLSFNLILQSIYNPGWLPRDIFPSETTAIGDNGPQTLPLRQMQGQAKSIVTHADSGYGDAQSVISDAHPLPRDQVVREEQRPIVSHTSHSSPSTIPAMDGRDGPPALLPTTGVTEDELSDNEDDTSGKTSFTEPDSTSSVGWETEEEGNATPPDPGPASSPPGSLNSEPVPTPSRSPSPLLESWYEEGQDVNFRDFRARIISERDVRSGPFPHMQRAHHFLAAYGAAVNSATQDPADTSTPQVPNVPNRQRSRLSTHHGLSNGEGSPWNDSGDEQGDKTPDPKRHRTMGPPDIKDAGLMFACPYQKRYSSDNLSCGRPHGLRKTYGWDMVSRVKHHLLQSHGKQYHCSNCWRASSSKPDALRCREKNCSTRPSPAKPWLADEQFLRLENMRVSNTPDGWYHIFSIVFPDLPEKGQRGYRATYTPYYCAWISKSSAESHSPPLGQALSSAFPTGDPSSADMEIWQQGPSAVSQFGILQDNLSGNNAEYNAYIGAFVQTAPTNIVPPFHWTIDETETTYVEDQLPENPMISLPEPLISTTPTSHNGTDSTSSTGGPVAIPITRRRCFCTQSQACSYCRLKQRSSRRGSEIETMRATFTEVLRIVERHDDIFQDMDGGPLVSDGAMHKFWGYQDELRNALAWRK